MANFLKDLKDKIQGDIKIDKKTLDYFSTDGSVFTLNPKLVIYPLNEMDVIETVRAFHFRANEGKPLSLTSRGKGTDQGGGSLSEGGILVFPAHMRKIISVDQDSISVQPGVIYSHLQSVLHSHGRFLPPYPASIDFCSIGGAVANNSAGEKTIKYGSTRNYIKSLRVVLSNGDLIETRRLNKKELKAKKQQQDFEGEIYRTIDELLENNHQLLANSRPGVSKNSAGYDLWDIKSKDGSFDLSQLFCGSQGTLGIITEMTLYHEQRNTNTFLAVGYFDSLESMTQATQQILPLVPSAMEIVDRNVLEFVQDKKPTMLEGILPDKMPEVIMLVEFDDKKPKLQHKKGAKAQAILESLAFETRIAHSKHEQDMLWMLRRRAAALMWMSDAPKKSLPIIEDGSVPVEYMADFLKEVYALLAKYNVGEVMWGHAGNANFHIQPLLDLSNLRDRHKVYQITDEFYKLINKYHGSTCAEHNDGIIRAPYLKGMFGTEVYNIFKDVKTLFDPNNFLNPPTKMGATKEFGMVHLRKEYSMSHLADHLPGLGSFH